MAIFCQLRGFASLFTLTLSCTKPSLMPSQLPGATFMSWTLLRDEHRAIGWDPLPRSGVHDYGNCCSDAKSLLDVADQIVRVFESYIKANETISICTSVRCFLQIGRYDQTRYASPAIAHLE